MPVQSITRLRIRRWRDMPAFMIYAMLSIRQSRRAAGNLGIALLKDRNRTYWTRTTWTDEAALRRFMMDGAHARAMPLLIRICDEASVVRWTAPDATPPSWPEAHRRMVSEGRPSKLRAPSAAHEAFEVPPPDAGRALTVRAQTFGVA